MEYCSLGNLENLQDVKPEQYVSVFRQMLDGLRHLHSNGVAHRDLKPANLLVADRLPLRIKISDFGLSKVVPTEGVLRTFCGTKLYAAPEVSGSAGYRPSVDIWSAGTIILQFVFGLPPTHDIDDLSGTEWFGEWSTMLLDMIEDLDKNKDQVIDLVKHMVTKKPENRLSANQCLQRGGDNGLFKRRRDGLIVDIDALSEDDATEVATEAETEIATPAANSSDDSGSDDGIATPTQALQWTESGTSNTAPSTLAGELCSTDEVESGRQESGATPSGQLTPTRGSNTAPSSRHLKSLTRQAGP